MNNDNGKNNHDSASNTTSIELIELGEVKTALGRLYKEFESLKQSQKSERERDRAELQAWAQTNLIQNQLLSKAMVTIEMLTAELKTQNISTSELEKNNADLMQQLTHFTMQSQNIPASPPTIEYLEFKGLNTEVSLLKAKWKELIRQTTNLTMIIQELKNSPPSEPIMIEKKDSHSEDASKYIQIALFTSIFTLLIFFIFNQVIPVKSYNNSFGYLPRIFERIAWVNTKLQHIEHR